MSAYVKVGRKTLRAAYDYVHMREPDSLLTRALWDALSPKKKASRASGRREREGKREAKREETRAIYTIVQQRAGDSCEACTGHFHPADRAELDHQLGRGRYQQSAANTWLIHHSCHVQRTNNVPSAAYWLEVMLQHAKRWEHHETARILSARLEGIVAARRSA